MAYSMMDQMKGIGNITGYLKRRKSYVEPNVPLGPNPIYQSVFASLDANRAMDESNRNYSLNAQRVAIEQQQLDLQKQRYKDEMEAAENKSRVGTGLSTAYLMNEMGSFKPPVATKTTLSPEIPYGQTTQNYMQGVEATQKAPLYTQTPGGEYVLEQPAIGGPTWGEGMPSEWGVMQKAGYSPTSAPATATEVAPTLAAGEATAGTLSGETAVASTLGTSAAGPGAISGADWSASMAAEIGAEGGAGAGTMGALGAGASVVGGMFLGATIGGLIGGGKGKIVSSAIGGGLGAVAMLTMTSAGASLAATLGLSMSVLGPIGFVVGAGLGALLGGGSIICTELYSQGYITKRELQLCEIFRRRHIDEEMYEGYLIWGGKVCEWLRGNGLKKKAALWFSLLFVQQMINVVKGRRGTFKQRMVGLVACCLSRVCYTLKVNRQPSLEVA